MIYKTVIGLEIHVELNTRSKLFCGCETSFGSEPNTHCCPVCLGLPGSLPVLNRRAAELAIRAGIVLNCRINTRSRFDRKNYFYPDLPKAYQISQFEHPLAGDGYLEDFSPRDNGKVRIERVHLEEEAGKLLHSGGSIMHAEYSLVDYNRAGIPLVEIVTAPDLSSGRQARFFLEELRLLLLYSGVSDCRMEEGSLRCDANISLMPEGSGQLGTRVEVKNMNSFRAVEAALDFETRRQMEILSGRGEVVQETRHWDEEKKSTLPLRGKEGSSDYRYFPEPDLPLLMLDKAWIKEIRESLPELPARKRARFREQHGLGPNETAILVNSPDLAEFYEKAGQHCQDYQELANWTTGEVLRISRSEEKPVSMMDPLMLVETVQLIQKGEINRSVAKEILAEALIKDGRPNEIMRAGGLGLIVDPRRLTLLIDKVLEENLRAVEDFRQGKEKALGFLIGRVMSATAGRSDPAVVKRLLQERILQITGKGGLR